MWIVRWKRRRYRGVMRRDGLSRRERGKVRGGREWGGMKRG
jgi:hypothetical protein